MPTARSALSDVTNKPRRAVMTKKQRMHQPTKKNKGIEDSKQLDQVQCELQKLDSTMKTPAGQKRSPSLCLRRREKKTRSRAALLNGLDENELQIMQRLDFTGCDGNDDALGLNKDENASSSSNVDEKTPPMTLKRKFPQSSELSVAAKRKKLPTDAPKKNLKSKRNRGATQAVDAAKLHLKLALGSEQLKGLIRNTCVLNSPGDKPARKARRSKSRNKKASSSTYGEQQTGNEFIPR